MKTNLLPTFQTLSWRTTRPVLAGCLWIAALPLLSQALLAQQPLQTFATGDIMVAVAPPVTTGTAGLVYRLSSSGAVQQTLSTGFRLTNLRGMAFDTAGDLYVTATDANAVAEFDVHGSLLGAFGAFSAANLYSGPYSILFDSFGNAYVTQGSGVLKLQANGTPLALFNTSQDSTTPQWSALAPDHTTLYYTAGGPSIKRFNVVTNTQMADFVNLGGILNAVRLLPDGTLLVAQNTRTTASVLRLNSSGSILQTYNVPTSTPASSIVTDIALDPDGKSFWTGLSVGTKVFKVNLASGSIVSTFDPGAGSGVLGLAVYGGPALNNIVITNTCPLPSAGVGQSYSQPLTAIGGGNGAYDWTGTGGLPPGLAVSGQNIAGIPTAAVSSNVGLFVSMPVVPPGSSGPRVVLNASKSCSLAVNRPLSLTGSCPGFMTAGGAVNVTLTASGGSGVYQLSYSGPAWLALSSASGAAGSNGTFVVSLSGTSPSAGVYPFTVTLSDSAGTPPAVFQCSVSVNPTPTPGAPVQIVSACPATPMNVGVSYSQNLVAAGGNGGYTWSIPVGSLPPGLSLASSSIAGSPTSPGTYAFNVRVNSGSQSDEVACQVRVDPPMLSYTSGCPGNGTQSVAYTPFPLIATGGLGMSSYLFEIVQGALPPGLSVENSSITGKPTTAGTWGFRIQVTSGTQRVLSNACSMVIAPAPVSPLSLTGTCPAGSSAAGSPVSVSLAAAGGQPPYQFALSGASWLSLSSSSTGATVSGTPVDPGSYPFTVTLNDQAGTKPATFACTLTVAPAPLQINGACPGTALTQGKSFTLPLSAAGGVPPYKWSLSGPSWMLMATSTGADASVAGTPTDTGAVPFTVTLTDSAGTTTTFSCTLTVNAPPLAPLTISAGGGGCPSAPLTIPTQFSLPLTAGGGQAPYAWSVSGASWLSLSSSTAANVTLSGSPTQAGSYSFTVTLKDSANSTPATYACTLTVNAATIPAVSVVGMTPPASITQPLNPVISLDGPTPVALTGTVQLSFTANAFGTTDDPRIQFLDPKATNNGRMLAFTIPAGAQSVALSSVQQDTVAGTVRVEVVSLLDGTRDVLPNPHPFATAVIPKLAPVITDMQFQNESSSGFDIVIAGYSTPRDMSSATVTFSAASGATLEGSSSVTVSLSSVFSTFYQTAASISGGSAFSSLRLPVSVSGDKTAIGSVAVVLTNSVGQSNSVSKNR